MRVLVAGRSGQLARSLIALGSDRVTALGRADGLDLTQPGSAADSVARLAPDVVVNAAAWTDVEGAEDHEDMALRLNADAPAELAGAAAKLGAAFIHISTDYVFDGAKPAPYVESDPVSPINAYGRTKLAGERAVMAAHPGAVILRTSWVYDHAGKNFPLAILGRAKTQARLSVVNDQHGCPTYVPDLAATVLALTDRLAQPNAEAGIFHAAGGAETTWHGFATAIIAAAGLNVPVDPVPASAYPTKAARPANSRLACHRLTEAYGLALPGWQDALPRFMVALEKLETSLLKKDA